MLIILLSVVKSTVSLALDAMLLLMFLRALISWFPDISESKFGDFLFTVTEWLITPMRELFDRMGWEIPAPIDVPFFATVLLLIIISYII